MLIKTDDIKTETYWIRDGFMVDIQTTPEYYDAYIYETSAGVKRQMFACEKDEMSYREYVNRIQNETEYYIELYNELMLDDIIYDESDNNDLFDNYDDDF